MTTELDTWNLICSGKNVVKSSICRKSMEGYYIYFLVHTKGVQKLLLKTDPRSVPNTIWYNQGTHRPQIILNKNFEQQHGGPLEGLQPFNVFYQKVIFFLFIHVTKNLMDQSKEQFLSALITYISQKLKIRKYLIMIKCNTG